MTAIATHDEAGFPRGALIGAGALVGFALLLTAAVRLGLVTAPPSPQQARVLAHVQPVVSRELRFLDRADGAVVVQDVSGGQVTTILPGTKNGFVRGVMRGLARERHMHGMGQAAPFKLVLWADHELSLTDEATGREIELGSFGATNRAAFATMLPGEQIMKPHTAFWRQTLDVGCTVEIDHAADNLGAHVSLDGDPAIGPGDRVRVYGAPIDVRFGDHLVVRRRAVIERATALGRFWTKVSGHFEMNELYDVSFTGHAA